MGRKIATIIRIILTLFLVYGIYTETGKWTVLFAVLTWLGLEALAYLHRDGHYDTQSFIEELQTSSIRKVVK